MGGLLNFSPRKGTGTEAGATDTAWRYGSVRFHAQFALHRTAPAPQPGFPSEERSQPQIGGQSAPNLRFIRESTE